MQEEVVFVHSFVDAKEDASDCAGLEDICGRPEEVVAVEATDNTRLGDLGW